MMCLSMRVKMMNGNDKQCSKIRCTCILIILILFSSETHTKPMPYEQYQYQGKYCSGRIFWQNMRKDLEYANMVRLVLAQDFVLSGITVQDVAINWKKW